jgi:catechol 2,3-dioxygenase
LCSTEQLSDHCCANAAKHKWNFVGAADHLVSEALYFSDRDDTGSEVYADRPGADWQREEHRVRTATLPLASLADVFMKILECS